MYNVQPTSQILVSINGAIKRKLDYASSGKLQLREGGFYAFLHALEVQSRFQLMFYQLVICWILQLCLLLVILFLHNIEIRLDFLLFCGMTIALQYRYTDDIDSICFCFICIKNYIHVDRVGSDVSFSGSTLRTNTG